MDLITPGVGLLFYQLLVLFSILVVAISWVLILSDKRLESKVKLIWMLGTFFLPIIGPVLFLRKYLKPVKKE